MQVDGGRFVAEWDLGYLVVEEAVPVGRQRLEPRRSQLFGRVFEVGRLDEHVEVGELACVTLDMGLRNQCWTLDHQELIVNCKGEVLKRAVGVQSGGLDLVVHHSEPLEQRVGHSTQIGDSSVNCGSHTMVGDRLEQGFYLES